jgi:hypothetical protein
MNPWFMYEIYAPVKRDSPSHRNDAHILSICPFVKLADPADNILLLRFAELRIKR